MKRRSRIARIASGVALSALLAGASGAAQDLSANIGRIEDEARRLDGTLGDGGPSGGLRRSSSVEERFADAELLYRLRDYSRASVLFTDIVENYRNTPAYPQGLFLLADSLYQAGDRYGARTRFREVLQNSANPVFRPFIQRALGRLIEIAIRMNDFSGVDEYFQRLGQIPPGEVEAQTSYVRGKYLFLRSTPDYEGARQAFESVSQRSPLYPQARYFLGAILTVQQRYPEAIEAFRRVINLNAEGAEQQQVHDLGALAVGRLEIERENYDAAIESYQLVGRSSQYFDRALFEQAWAYIKSGDSIRSERALEILSISSPDSPLIPEAKLLWGNLLLRTGRFDRAQQVFQEVRTQFGPIYQRLQEMNAQHQNPEQYFQELVRSNLQVFDASSFIPQEALAYVRHEGSIDDSLQVVSDLNVCRTYVREASEIIDRLNAALNAPSRSHVFEDLGRARRVVWELLNRMAQIRLQVAESLDGGASATDADLQGVISQRRSLAAVIGRLPIDDDQMRRRDRQADNEFQNLSQGLQRDQQRVESLEAMIVAIERYLSNPSRQQTRLNADQLRTELTTLRAGVQGYRERITALRRQISQGRAQMGPGDPRYAHDAEARTQLRDLVDRQSAGLTRSGGMSGDAQSLLTRLRSVEDQVTAIDGRINGRVEQRITGLQTQVREEEGRVAGYRERLSALESESAQVVGGLILQQFRDVQLQFYRIVMRADLGLVDVSWEQREEHNNRARMLAEEQSREINALRDEYEEVTEGASPEDAERLSNQGSGQRPNASGSPPSSTPPTAPPAAPPATNSPQTTTPTAPSNPTTPASQGAQSPAPAAPAAGRAGNL